jgi:glycosyltransferase involved in cell wall biosynthesis
MARALAARGHDIGVVCVARREGRAWDEPLRDPRVTVYPVRYPFGQTFYGAGAPDVLFGARSFPWKPWLGAPAALAALLAAARRELAGAEALVSHFILPSGALAGLVRRGRPHVAVVHGTDGWLLGRFPAAFQRAVLRGATRLWFTHAALRAALAESGVPDCVRPMGWEGAPVSGARERGAGAPLAVMVSRLVPVKRVELAVRALGGLTRDGVNVNLVVLGDGPERPALEALARRVAPGRVRWEGAVDGDVRDAWLTRASVFVHTAGGLADGRTEGAPVALVEAMAAGLAVVAVDHGGVREIVGDAGRVVRETDVAEALRELLTDGALRARLGARARERAAAWRWDALAAALEQELFSPSSCPG